MQMRLQHPARLSAQQGERRPDLEVRAWCKQRRGKLTDDEIEALAAFTDVYGWNMRFHV